MAETSETETAGAVVPSGDPAPMDILTPQDATAERIARGMSPEQAKAFRAMRKEKKEKAKAVPAAGGNDEGRMKRDEAPASVPETARAEVPASQPETETITLGGDEEAPPTETTTTTTSEAELSEEELAKLDEKARKRITEASKEAAKVRKRAQEAEAKLKEQDAKVSELETKLADLEKLGSEAATRALTLAGNSFVQFTDGHAVAAWAENAKQALALINYHEREVKAGRRDADEPISHTLPTGQEIEIKAQDAALYSNRVQDAQAWFTHDAEIGKVKQSAAKLAEKHTGTKGYKEALDAYRKDPALTTRFDELLAKAAFYDVLQSRKASITFMDTAGAANRASSPAAESQAATRKTPPSETPASTPRLAQVNDPASDLKARKSLLMQKAMTAKTEDERQKYLKEAIKLGNPGGSRSLARA